MKPNHVCCHLYKYLAPTMFAFKGLTKGLSNFVNTSRMGEPSMLEDLVKGLNLKKKVGFFHHQGNSMYY